MNNPDIYALDQAGRCLLCYNSPCSKACKSIDTGKAIRSYYFKNTQGASLQLAGTPNCASCTTQACRKVCLRGRVDNPIDIPFLISHIGQSQTASVSSSGSEPSLEIEFCGFRCENPFVLASSVITSTYDMCASALRAGWGGVATKTISYHKSREVSPRFDVSYKSAGHFGGFRNLEQLSEHPVERDFEWVKRLKRDFPSKLIIVSIMGSNEAEWQELARLTTQSGADIIECNFSCPQMTQGGMGSDMGQNSHLVRQYTKATRRGSTLPIIAKLTPNLSAPDEFVKAAIEGGADGIAGINTIKSLTNVDFQSADNAGIFGKTAVSGYSGRAVRPIALRFMHDTALILPPAQHTMSGMGGIETWRDAMDFIMIGCANVQVCTAVMEYGQRIIEDLTEGMQLFLKSRGLTSLNSLVGSALERIVAPADLDRQSIVYPQFNKTTCIGCNRCFVSCTDGGHQAIALTNGRLPMLIEHKCVGCHLCRLVCPVGSITQRERTTLNLETAQSPVANTI